MFNELLDEIYRDKISLGHATRAPLLFSRLGVFYLKNIRPDFLVLKGGSSRKFWSLRFFSFRLREIHQAK